MARSCAAWDDNTKDNVCTPNIPAGIKCPPPSKTISPITRFGDNSTHRLNTPSSESLTGHYKVICATQTTSWALDSSETKPIASEIQTAEKVQTTDPAQAKKQLRTIYCIRHNRRLQYRNTLPLLFYTQDKIYADPNITFYGPSVGVISTDISAPEHLSWPADCFKMCGRSASVPPVNVLNTTLTSPFYCEQEIYSWS